MKKTVYIVPTIFIAFVLCIGLCSCRADFAQNSGYKNSTVYSDLYFSDDISNIYSKVDIDYAYNKAVTLANDPNLSDYMLWRTSGSDGEHKAADYLEKEMTNIGLSDVKKLGIPCDKFQLNYTSLTIDDTDINIHPGSYQHSGTNGNLHAEIVDCDNGHLRDYSNDIAKNKIALVHIDQVNDVWIDTYAHQAKEAGALALVTWCDSGYAEANYDDINVQDVCCNDLLPIASISTNDAKKILDNIHNGKNQCNLNIDTNYELNNGTTYNILGKIPGKDNSKHIVLGAHYDKYWKGFQDDSCAVSLVLTVAKAMIDSKYQPEHDIYVALHGAEEWGVADSQNDWATGSWGLCEYYPEFAQNTLVLLNCELPAFKRENNLRICSVPELKNMVEIVLADKIVITAGDIQIEPKAYDLTTREDGISYRTHGIPYFFDSLNSDPWIKKNYHTQTDNENTFDEDTFITNLNWYISFCVYSDKMANIPYNFVATAETLENQFNEDSAAQAGVDIATYKKTINDLKKASENFSAELESLNYNYDSSVKNKRESDIEANKRHAQILNDKARQAFKLIQDRLLKVCDNSCYYGHTYADESLDILKKTVLCLDEENLLGDKNSIGAIEQLGQLNSGHELRYAHYSVDATRKAIYSFDNTYYKSPKQAQWSWNKMDPVIDVEEAAIPIFKATTFMDIQDVEHVKDVLKSGQKQCLDLIAKDCQNEIETMQTIISIISK